MKKNLSQLACEYFESARLQGEIINSFTEKKKMAILKGTYADVAYYNQALCVLYSARRELLETANQLKEYYKHSQRAKGGVDAIGIQTD